MTEPNNHKVKYTVKRIGGYLHKITTIVDGTGKVIHTAITPFMIELKPKDILQIIVGATILAIPVGLTEETWVLAQELKTRNVFYLACITVFFISLFVYFNFYRFNIKGNVAQYIKRVLATYGLSLVVVGLLLTIIQRCPWGVDNILAVKRIIITALPASMAATLSDTIR